METTPPADPALAAILERLDRIDGRLDALGVPDPPDPPPLPNGPPVARRRLRLLDIMILVAAMAFGLPAYRSMPFSDMLERFDHLRGFWHVYVMIMFFWTCTVPFILPATLALAIIRLLPPRPRLRAMAGMPGTLGVGIAAALLIAYCPIDTLPLAVYGDFTLTPAVYIYLIGIPKVLGCGILGAWLTLAALGRFRRPADRLDALCSALCVYWMLSGLMNASFMVLLI